MFVARILVAEQHCSALCLPGTILFILPCHDPPHADGLVPGGPEVFWEHLESFGGNEVVHLDGFCKALEHLFLLWGQVLLMDLDGGPLLKTVCEGDAEIFPSDPEDEPMPLPPAADRSTRSRSPRTTRDTSGPSPALVAAAMWPVLQDRGLSTLGQVHCRRGSGSGYAKHSSCLRTSLGEPEASTSRFPVMSRIVSLVPLMWRGNF